MSTKRGTRRPGETLTPRELEVIELLATGAKNAVIGARLGISVETVRRHLINIFDKTGVDTRVELVVWKFSRLLESVENAYEGGLPMTMLCPMCDQQVTAVLAKDGATVKLRPHGYSTSQLVCPGSRCSLMAPKPSGLGAAK